MITAEEEEYILRSAYIPEHSVGLMTRVSGGEPLLIEDYFCCRKDDWLIVVGYPLEQNFAVHEFETFVDKVTRRFRPTYVSLIAPELPTSLAASCQEKESDQYYTLDIHTTSMKSGLRRTVDGARDHLTVEHSLEIRQAHEELMLEFTERVRPQPRVRELLFKIPEYVGHARDSIVLNGWDQNHNLAAFYVVDLAPKNFSTYVIGCHSKKNYVPGASDLLLFETINISKEYCKNYVHLGLGVNKGIRQFKKKWGGIPTIPYEMCEIVVRKPSIFESIMATQKILKIG